MLFDEARRAGADGRPVKSVFDTVASKTGRKPNSIRNYYYLKLREQGEHRAAFTPFCAEEVDMLLRAMLTGQAKGRSVRSIATELGEGDKKRMLRYQNKYRSMLRTDPGHVKDVREKLMREGVGCADPFLRRRRYGNADIAELSAMLAENLARTDVDAQAFLGGLVALSAAAAHRTEV